MFKRALAFAFKPLTLTLTLFILQLALFIWITVRPFAVAPEGRTYNVLRGQGAYTSFIRQAQDGAWKLYSAYTTRPTPAIYVDGFYAVVGHIARLFALDPVYTYMVTRVVCGLILFLATYWIITILLPKNMQALAIFLALGAEPGPLLSAIHNLASLVSAPPAIFSYFPQEVVLRHFGLPHHVLAEAAGLFLLGNVFLYSKHTSWTRLAGIGILTIAGTLLMPAYNMIVVAAVILPWGIWSTYRHEIKKLLPPILLIILLLGCVGLFTKYQLDAGYPWKNFNLDEKRWVTDGSILINYISSLVLYIPVIVALCAYLPTIWRRTYAFTQLLIILTCSWLVIPVALLPLTHLTIFPLANFRLMDGYMYVPAAILATIGLYELTRVLKKRSFVRLGAICMIMASLILTFNFTRLTLTEQQNIWMNVYPLNQEWDAIRFLSTVPKRSGVLVLKYFGEIIPSYATVRVFLGETPGAIDWNDRYVEAVKFYWGTLSDEEACAMLSREDISYIYWGGNEKQLMKTPSLYPDLLVPVFQNPAVTIFVVKK